MFCKSFQHSNMSEPANAAAAEGQPYTTGANLMNEREHRNAVYTVTTANADSAANLVLRRLGEFGVLVRESHLFDDTLTGLAGRNLWTRSLDKLLKALRRYAPPLHFVGYLLTAIVLFLYARLLGFTTRLVTGGEERWPEIRGPAILALWHGDAPALITAFAAKQPRVEVCIMVGSDPRGDSLALLCRLLGLRVERGDNEEGGWEALAKLALLLEQGVSVLITPDGTGPARRVKPGILALASVTGVPIVPIGASCYPAVVQRRKWDAARNPLPFSRVSVVVGSRHTLPLIRDTKTLLKERDKIEEALTEASSAAVALVR